MSEIKLEDLGYRQNLEKFRIEQGLDRFEIGRIISEHKDRYIVKTVHGEFKAKITGTMRFTANSREDFPAVGDWVALTPYDSDVSIIHKILPRFSVIKRKAVGRFGEIQIIAVNIDYAFIIQAIDQDFNMNRLERYLTICNSSQVKPVIILSKIDLITESRLNEILDRVTTRIKHVPIHAVSNETLCGYEPVKEMITKGKTYCLLGSSGVGKSSLLNNLSGKTIMRTDRISDSTNKGRHVTSHRELIILDDGGILIDNPGMREVGIVETPDGLEMTLDAISELSQNCKFKDCTHTHEIECSVLESIEKGEIDKASYENYLKIEREKVHFESSVTDRRRKDKEFGKFVKNYKKSKNKSR